MLQDVGSTTGTFLLVREELPLDHLMVLQVGTTELTVYVEGDQCTLVATEGPDKDARSTVPSKGITVGRETSNGLCIRDPQISAFHCEVRRLSGGSFILEDKYSTNRTWLRLAPDGLPSKRLPLRDGDLFKVGSTLFLVIDNTPHPPYADSASGTTGTGIQGSSGVCSRPVVPRLVLPGTSNHSLEDDDHDVNHTVVPNAAPSLAPLVLPSRAVREHLSVPLICWEPFVEGEARPILSREEYARRITASRRRMHADGSARRGSPSGVDQPEHRDLKEQELTSLQQRMRNSRAQTAYALEQQRPSERGNEDLCKICYDHDIDVLLYPCGHMVICRWCAQKVSDCPVCRMLITNVIRTYRA